MLLYRQGNTVIIKLTRETRTEGLQREGLKREGLEREGVKRLFIV